MNLNPRFLPDKFLIWAKRNSEKNYSPRWIVVMIDIFILIFSFYLTYFILDFLNVKPINILNFYEKTTLVVGLNFFFMYLFKTYSGVIRHTSFFDLAKLILTILLTIIILFVVNKIFFHTNGSYLIRVPVLVIYGTFSFVFLFLFRLSIRAIYHYVNDVNRSKFLKKILILGTDVNSIAIANVVISNTNSPYEIFGFLTINKDNLTQRISSKPIFSKSKLTKEFVEENDIEFVLINKDSLTRSELNAWVSFLMELDLKMLKAPSIEKLKDKNISSGFQKIQIEDLLNRESISMDKTDVELQLNNKKILVTGGAGSIGSEIVRQVAKYNPALVVVLDQAETPLYSLELEMKQSFPHIDFRFVLADISNKYKMDDVFKKYQFDVVYHAAAYKHVPMIEENPHESIYVNVLGTKLLSSFACQYNVSTFVMVSTDKAVNPTNVMGASKRVAELFVQALQNEDCNGTKFITTRFGNVLGSNGSVIPHFEKQIENGGPVTITHPDIVRYFMTIPEACELVLQAGTMGKGGEIYVFDMGKPVKILDLATRMIKLYGLEPHLDIPIVYTGLRPGEKLYEELLSDITTTIPTINKKILISKDPCRVFSEIDDMTKNIIKAAIRKDKMEVVRHLKYIVPEFVSNNSIYQSLD